MESIQQTLGVADGAGNATGYTNDKKKGKKPGIDVVLGSQWGDEGKGKLVDMLSQVRSISLRNLFQEEREETTSLGPRPSARDPE